MQTDLIETKSPVDFIFENMPPGGYAMVGRMLNKSRVEVRNEIITRKKQHNAEIVDACIKFLERLNIVQK